MSRFYGTSGLSRSSSEYSASLSKTLEGHHNRGAVVLRPHSGWTLCRHWIHIAAVAVTAGLAAINILNIYLMDADTAESGTILNAFQFAAKLHEVLIVASLMLVMMDTVRGRLTSSSGVPFGYLLAPVLFNDLDWLTSHHFWSSVKPTWSSLPLTVLVLTAVPFANLAGPLSAITVVPRLGWSIPQAAAVFPTFWNASSGTMWPDTLSARDLAPVCTTSAGQQAGCPASAFKNVWISYDPAFQGATDCTTSGLRVACNTTLGDNGFRQLSLEYDLDSLTTYASTPTDVVYETIAARFVGGMALSLNLSDTKVIDAQKVELIDTSFVGNREMLKPVTRTTCKDLTYSEIYQTVQDFVVETDWKTPTAQWVGNIDGSQKPSFLFTYLRNASSLEAAMECDGQGCYAAVSCTTDARWVPSSMWYNTGQTNIVYHSHPQPQALYQSDMLARSRPVVIEKGWLDAFNISGARTDVSEVFVDFLNHWSVPMVGTPSTATNVGTQGPPNPSNYTQTFSILVSSIVTEGMARASTKVGYSVYTDDCSDTRPGFRFANGICAEGSSHWIHTDSLGDLENDLSLMTFQLRRNGYGWFIDSITVKIALGILLVHGILTMVYVIVSIAFRRSITTCWSSAPEMLMLAIDSLRAPVLMGSSAKAMHRNLWSQPVSVVEVDGGERVSLIVGDPLSYADRLGGPPMLGKEYN